MKCKMKGGLSICNLFFIVSLLVTGLITGCSVPVTLVHVQSFEAKSEKLDLEAAFNRITGILVDRGFDIKVSNKDAGLLTTEYKKFASVGQDPPFDMYIQIRISLAKKPDGKLCVKVSPIVKEQNRLNAAAFTEHELSYYIGKPENLKRIESMKPGGWQVEAQTLFMNIVTDVGEMIGISVDEMEQHVTKTPKSISGF